LLNREQMLEMEPHVAGIAAVRVPQEGIVDYMRVCETIQSKIEAAGGKVVLQAKVTQLESRSGVWLAKTTAGDFEGDFIVNCCGLHSDRMAELAGEKRDMRIEPFRGEYFKIRPDRQFLVKNLIYPVPDPQFPFLGVHYTRLIEGGVEAGPNAVLAFSREGYKKTDLNIPDLFDAVSYGGLWRFLNKHKRMCWHEVKRSFSKELFCKALQRLVPEIREEDLTSGGAGVRAQAMAPEGELIHDFCLVRRANALHVLNAPSPAATASLAIGGEIVNQVADVFKP
jgi:(S)-2-hydroxyglutarate dehydrogenase